MELEEEVPEASKRVLGEERLLTTSMDSLARSYGDLGRRQGAVELEEKVLETRKRTLVEGHSHTLTSMGDLAIISSSQNLWWE